MAQVEMCANSGGVMLLLLHRYPITQKLCRISAPVSDLFPFHALGTGTQLGLFL